MMEELKSWVFNMAVFIVLYSVVQMIMPNKHYKKYIELVLGLIFIIIVAQPIIRLLGMDSHFRMQTLNSSVLIQEERLKVSSNYYDDKQQSIIREQYKNVLHSQIEHLIEKENFMLVESDITISEGENFGELESVWISITEKIEGEENRVLDIEPVKIENIQMEEKEIVDEVTTQEQQLLMNKVKGILADYYQLDKDQIIVQLQNMGGNVE